ncbi:MAG: DUF4419 domain-containing protein [Roseofilum sp. SBFL]|uniref:DUF4419 domain-containing protein n=1 Tax=Roseofilum sp. SBFL TaxID=2821496 RepID=UPI001B2AE615|nr:DUF4419 domain-containing protein [Roseofilum sp. SBFL]MBP0044673.1 DUF4419 domain-containing protein [Roseofilum sp. SBFL]
MPQIAPILNQQYNQISFSVDQVEQATELLPTQEAKSQFERQLEKPVLAFSHDDRFQTVSARYNHPLAHGIHPLAFAVHLAFSEHRPLLLTPDIIWITIAQGFAHHVNNHAEELRDRLVSHSGKETLTIEVFDIPKQADEWSKAVHQWTLLIRNRVGAELYHLLECSFSTTTPNALTASRIVMMDTFRQYFDYEMLCICGIPKITLLGTVQDWQSICDRVRMMAKYNLTWWTDRLLTICEEFVKTASGKPSLSFWQQIYKPQALYADDVITGWLADLFPYLLDQVTNAPSMPNPILAIARSDITVNKGISPRLLPLGLSQVPLKLTFNQKEYSLELLAGFIGVCQHPDEGTLSPEVGWAVRERDKLQRLLDNIEHEHITQKPINWSNFRSINYLPKEHIQILERFDGATLYPNSGHSWILTKYDVHKYYRCKYYVFNEVKTSTSVQHLIELEDKRCIGYTHENLILLGKSIIGYIDEGLIFHDKSVSATHPLFENRIMYGLKDTVVIAQGIEQLLERIFQAEGRYYFDNPSFAIIS